MGDVASPPERPGRRPAPRRPQGRELLPPAVRLYLLVGLAALAAFYAMPYDTLFQDTIYYPALGLASVRRDRRRGSPGTGRSHPLPWLLFAAGQLLFVAGDVLFGVYEHLLGTHAVPVAGRRALPARLPGARGRPLAARPPALEPGPTGRA